MKKLTFSFLLAAIAFQLSAQTSTQRLVLVEEFTNASCGPCALSNPAFNTLMTNNAGKAVCIRYHTSFPGSDPMYTQNNIQNQARTVYYSITSVPNARMDGAGTFLQDVNQTSIDAEYGVSSPIKITLTYHLSSDNDSIYVKCVVKALSTVTGTMKAQIAVVEKMINFSTAPGTNGEKDFPMVVKKMLPDQNGTALPATMNAGDSIVINTGWLLANVYNLSQLATVAFVQDNTTKNVKQSAYAPTPTTTVVNPPTITLNTVTQALCSSGGGVNINVSGGTQPYTYHWSNGATTQDISGVNSGTYTVTVTGGTASATASYTVQTLQLEKPSLGSVSNKTPCSIQLNWNTVTGTDHYEVKFRFKDSAQWSSAVNVGTALSFNFQNLIPDHDYELAVAADCSSGSNAGFKTLIDSTEDCGVVTGITVTQITSTTAYFSWSASCYSQKYRLLYRPVGSTTWIAKWCSTGVSYSAAALQPNTQYEYLMRNNCGTANSSKWSTNAHFTTSAQRVEMNDENSVVNEMNVYPNPSSGEINILGSFSENSKTASLEIRNVLGQIVYAKNISLDNGVFDESIRLPSNISNGLYFISTVSGNEKNESHLMIQK